MAFVPAVYGGIPTASVSRHRAMRRAEPAVRHHQAPRASAYPLIAGALSDRLEVTVGDDGGDRRFHGDRRVLLTIGASGQHFRHEIGHIGYIRKNNVRPHGWTDHGRRGV